MPYDWRAKGFFRRLKGRWWNPAEPRLIVPKAFGWGTTSTSHVSSGASRRSDA
jgi:hypothetical protein